MCTLCVKPRLISADGYLVYVCRACACVSNCAQNMLASAKLDLAQEVNRLKRRAEEREEQVRTRTLRTSFVHSYIRSYIHTSMHPYIHINKSNIITVISPTPRVNP